jgi:hypothetical protein
VQGYQPGFGGGVVCEIRGAEFSQHGGYGDDCAALGRGEEGGEEGLQGVEVRVQVC